MWSLFYFFLYIVLVLPGSTRIHCIWRDPDPDQGKEIEVDPDPRRGLKWIRIRIRNAALNGQETQRFPLLPWRFAAVGGLEREVVAEGRHLPVHQLQHLDIELARCRRRRYPNNV